MQVSASPVKERMTVSRKFVILNGLAILAVVINHATHWGLISIHTWSALYSAFISPFNQAMEAVMEPVLFGLAKLATFCVPAFLFTSGYFLAYIYKGQNRGKQWKVILTRVLTLIIPYLIWSGIFFLIDGLQGTRLSVWKYGLRLLYGGALPEYYFVPMLVQFYLLCPWLVDWCKQHWKAVLGISALLQTGIMAVCYLNVFIPIPVLGRVIENNHHWSLFPTWGFFFCLGLVFSLRQDNFLAFIQKHKVSILSVAVLAGAFAIFEAAWANAHWDTNWRDTPVTLPTSIYACAVIFTFLGLSDLPISPTGLISKMGMKSYGIYLIHPLVLMKGAYLVSALIPWLLANQVLFQIVLVSFGIGIPLGLMELVARTPVRKVYRYLFG